MMKKYFALALALLLPFASALSMPAHKGSARVMQPDGSYVTIRLHGDEYLHFNTTADGYTVVQDDRGYYVYATLDAAGRLKATAQAAHEVSVRGNTEADFLKTMPKMLRPTMSKQAARQKEADGSRRVQSLEGSGVQRVNYENFHGLILLVEYNDKSFKYANYRDLMDEMANKENYQGNSITNVSNRVGICTGSVRDFYADCSNGQFIPTFDVIGPVKIDYSQYDINWQKEDVSVRVKLMADVIDAADPLVDFSQYDADGNGVVDLVYIIFAGMGSNFPGNDERLMWPHQSDFYNPNSNGWSNLYIYKDGVRLGHYACGTELYGTKDWNTLDGIGTIAHEFGHVLGLPDFYDTDYEESGGESNHPGEWTVMAGGGYMNYGRTPSVYTLFERYMLGWATPQVIEDAGSYTLESIDESNSGFRLNTPVAKEYFMIENRQQTKWNQYLPGHGMLVFRVDSTNATVWRNNTVNANPKHNYFEMVRAGGYAGTLEAASDPFPGSNRVTMLSNTTSPANLLTWAGKSNALGLRNIAESRGIVTFDAFDVNVLTAISIPATAWLATGTTYQVTVEREPESAPYSFAWTSSDESVCTVDADGLLTGIGPGTATITVSDSGEARCTAQCTVTVEDMMLATDIADCKQKEEGTEVSLALNGAQVLFVHKNDIYLRDATGAIVLSGMGFTDLKQGDVLTGQVVGRFAVTGKIPQLVSVGGRTSRNSFTATQGEAATPREVYTGDLTDGDYADLLTLKAVLLGRIDGLTGMFAIEGDNQVRIFNTFGLNTINTKVMTSDLSSRYDITGILLTNTVSNQLIDELAMTVTPTKSVYEPYVDSAISDTRTAADADATTRIYTLDGRRVDTMKSGLYLVKTGNKTIKVLQK